VALALFDLDHTLLDGDSDVLWCEFLLAAGQLEGGFAERNRLMEAQYQAGTVSAQDFCAFYCSTLAGRTLADWQPWRERFLDEVIAPRLTMAARDLVESHRERGDRLVLTTATNRVLTELTARHLDIADLLATECEVGVEGRFTGSPCGVLNMREGKVTRLHDWLREQGLGPESLRDAVFYSDSANDLPLLQAVGRPVAVNPDARLRVVAAGSGWPLLATR
jgi:HAD superfamily hydrolase (TIGR01490 family)